MDRLAHPEPHKELGEIATNIMRCHVRISAGSRWHRVGPAMRSRNTSLWSGALDDRPPELLISLDQADKVGGGHRPEGHSGLFKVSLQVRITQRLEEVPPQLVNDRLRRPLGGD